jgi:chitinase
MIGVNDSTNGIQELSHWSLGRDEACSNSGTLYDICSGTSQSAYQFANTFKAITGGGTVTPPPPPGSPAGTITGYGGKCVDVNAANTANGTTVQLYDCNGSGAQVWQHQSNSELLDPASGKCLDAIGPSSANGTRPQIWTCGGGANQQWNIPS